MKEISLLFLFLIVSVISFGQDTLKLSFQEAEKVFTLNNLDLISSHYNIDANKALIRQAKLWDNPTLTTDQNIYDNLYRKYFIHNTPLFGVDNPYGQIFIQVTQVIKTAHKRGYLIDMAETQTNITQDQFDDLMRNIRYQIHVDLLQLSYYNKQSGIYTSQISLYSKEKDTTGILKSIIFGLKNDLVLINVNKIAVESDLKTLLGINKDVTIIPVFTYNFKDLVTFKTSIPQLYEGLDSRYDIKMVEDQIKLSINNLNYQKSLAYPDINMGVEWDQRSSYTTNYWGLDISVPLPILNRNQGNIKSAKFLVEQQKSSALSLRLKSENEINKAYKTMLFYQSVNNADQLAYSNEDLKSKDDAIRSYKNGRMSLSDLIISLNAYKDNRLKVLDQHQSLINSVETLNFLSNKQLFKF